MTSNLLKKTLRANAVFSALCAVDLIMFSQPIAKIMGDFDATHLTTLGYSLIGFVVLLLLTSERQGINLGLAKSIVYGDFVWVVGSALLLIFASPVFSVIGHLMIAAIAFVVAVFAYYQNKGILQLSMLASENSRKGAA